MARDGWKRALLCGVLALAAPVMTGGLGPTTGWQERVLAGHNREREIIGVAPMHWDAELADDAQRWADELARTGDFRHAPERAADPEGENLWAGTRSYFPVEAMVGAWIAEKRNFRPGVFPDNSRTGRVEDVGHYTQVAWRDTRAVGCALARSSEEDILVCRYKQAGNWRGEIPF